LKRLAPGTLVIAAPSEDDDPIFGRAVVLIVDHEPNGIIAGLALNRPLSGQRVSDTVARALLFVPEPSAPVSSSALLMAWSGSTCRSANGARFLCPMSA
jgi:putative AlgH/UPF0301 family transcriptional regulator